MTVRRYVYDKETDEMVEVPVKPTGRQLPACRVRRFDSGGGGIKLWSRRPHTGPGPDPRGFTQHDVDGVPVVSSRREIDEVEGTTSYTDDPLEWSDDVYEPEPQ